MKKIFLITIGIVALSAAINHFSSAVEKTNDTIDKSINEVKEKLRSKKLRELARKNIRNEIIKVSVICCILASTGLAALYAAIEMYYVYTSNIEAAVAMSDGNLYSIVPLILFSIIAIILYVRARIKCKKNGIDVEEVQL